MKLSESCGRRILTVKAVAQPASSGCGSKGTALGPPSTRGGFGFGITGPHIGGSCLPYWRNLALQKGGDPLFSCVNVDS